jgi:regulator of sigma E protease
MAILVFILTILTLVTIHELGHFLMARKFNIKVLEFGFGIPPRLWGKKIGETLVSINLLPYGGFVRLLGEDEDDKEVRDNPRSFAKQSLTKRITVVVAGVFMNLFLAFILFYITLGANNFTAQIPLIAPHQFVGVNQTNESPVIVTAVEDDSPAKEAGLEEGDRILSLNDHTLISTEELISLTKQSLGQEVKLVVGDVDGEDTKEVKLTPRENPPEGKGAIGIALTSAYQVANLEYATPAQKIFSGPIHSFNLTIYSMEVLGKLIGASFATQSFGPVSQSIAGPVGITNIVGQILEIKDPLLTYLDFLALISLNLAIVNVLPFPGLDGGRLLFLIVEGITRKKAHPTLEKYVHTVGLVVLIGLIILVTISDVKKLIY